MLVLVCKSFVYVFIRGLPSCRWAICGCGEWHRHQRWLPWSDCPILRLREWPIVNDVAWYVWLSNLSMHFQPTPIPFIRFGAKKKGEKREQWKKCINIENNNKWKIKENKTVAMRSVWFTATHREQYGTLFNGWLQQQAFWRQNPKRCIATHYADEAVNRNNAYSNLKTNKRSLSSALGHAYSTHSTLPSSCVEPTTTPYQIQYHSISLYAIHF